MRIRRFSFGVVAILVLLLVSIVPLIVYAEENETDVTSPIERAQELREQVEVRNQALREQAQTRQERIKARLSEVRQRVCERRQEALEHRAGVIQTVANRYLEHLNAIFERVQNYVSDQELDVADYETLVDAVEAAQAAAQTQIDSLDEDVPVLDCENENNRPEVEAIKASVVNTVMALKNYRSSLHDLIKAVKEAVRGSEGEG